MPMMLSLAKKAEGAIVGGAVGDALGWPQENRSGLVNFLPHKPEAPFRAWRRRAGGYSYAHLESIGAGCYSDDTQLVLSTARSLFTGDEWFSFLTKQEFPTFSLYERGGGRAVKSAIKAWCLNIPPWSLNRPESDRRKYFEAGANGVAMRIFPHCVWHADSDGFAELGRDVFRNGITTHGHPRALIGALAFAYAGWYALRLRKTLEFGELVRQTLAAKDVWSNLPECVEFEEWYHAANSNKTLSYLDEWTSTVHELEEMLTYIQRELESGLQTENEVLRHLGCSDSERSGAGTVTTAGALFLVSKSGGNPNAGLRRACFLEDADTDTLGAMVGSLAGAVFGTDWITECLDSVQDRPYLRQIALDLSRRQVRKAIPEVRQVTLASLRREIFAATQQREVTLPDTRSAIVESFEDVEMLKEDVKGSVCRLRTEDGQTIFITRLKKASPKPLPLKIDEDNQLEQRQSAVYETAPDRPLREPDLRVTLLVQNLERSARLFTDLGFRVVSRDRESIDFGALVLEQLDSLRDRRSLTSPILCLYTDDVHKAYRVVQKFGLMIDIRENLLDKRGAFTFDDFDGYNIRILRRRGLKTPKSSGSRTEHLI